MTKRDTPVTVFRCKACGLLTTGRLPRGPWGEVGDGSLLYPRRHPARGPACPGVHEEAEMVDVPRGTRVFGGVAR